MVIFHSYVKLPEGSLGSPMRQCATKKHLDFRPAADADFPVSGPAVLGRSGAEESEELPSGNLT